MHPFLMLILCARLNGFQDYIHAVTDAEARVARLEAQIAELLPDFWTCRV
jgi:hypothetical protein